MQTNNNTPPHDLAPRVRFAPSPTGHLHIGGARQAVFNWLFAKANGGKFLLRIEDTDLARSTQEYKNSIIAALDWLGLIIDEDVVIQSHNQEYHRKIALELIERGLAYRCYCSQETLQELRESSSEDNFRYPGTCSQFTETFAQTEELANRPWVIRFRLPEGLPEKLEFCDRIKGPISIDASLLDDFVIIKSDGIATYNFAVVLDDLSMGITHVLRGEDHVINTFRQIQLYHALGKPLPYFAHAPMILGPNGERLSKRHGATSVIDYQAMGILPDAMFNYLAKIGWSHGDDEIFSRQELCKLFTLEGVSHKNGIFDLQKLLWLNSVYLKQLSFSQFLQHLRKIDLASTATLQNAQTGLGEAKLNSLFTMFQPRVNTLLDLAKSLLGCLDDSSATQQKRLAQLSAEQQKLCADFLAEVHQIPAFDAKNLQELAKNFIKARQLTLPNLAKPLRLLLTGEEEGPSVFTLLEVMGKKRYS